jgi:hypothetical protein
MIVTITFTAEDGEVVSGIPRFINIASSEPSTIYYTLDGTLPSQLSSVYTGPVELPTDQNSVTLSSVGYFLDGYGDLVPTPVLSNTYFTDVSELKRARYFLFDGIVYMYPGGLDIPFWYDDSGDASVFIDIPVADLENISIQSDREIDGSYRGTENNVTKIEPSRTQTFWDDDYKIFDIPSSDTFNPHALFIYIDGTLPTNTDDVLLINGPNLDLRDPRRNYSGLDFFSNNNTNYRSGNFTKHYYDREKGIVVFYYFDSNNGRWVKSKQNLAPVDTNALPKPAIGNPVVFEWFNFGRHQAI